MGAGLACQLNDFPKRPERKKKQRKRPPARKKAMVTGRPGGKVVMAGVATRFGNELGPEPGPAHRMLPVAASAADAEAGEFGGRLAAVEAIHAEGKGR